MLKLENGYVQSWKRFLARVKTSLLPLTLLLSLFIGCQTQGPSSPSTSEPIFKSSAIASTWRVASGGTAYTDTQGNLWAADNAFTGGSTNGNTNAITGTSDAKLYQNERWGNPGFTYTFDVPAGSYQVTLKFAEIFDATPGQRIFNVSINGTQVLTNFEIFAAAGGMNRAIDRVFNNIAPNAAGQIVIQFASTAASPDKNSKVNALQVIPQPGAPTLTPTRTSTPLSATSTPTRTPTPTNTFTRTSTPTPTLSMSSTWRVASGGTAYTDTLGNVWAADKNFTGGSTNGNTNTILGTSDAKLYQNERYGNPGFSYSFSVPSGNYQVTLKFAEIFDATPGQRIFNVSINGTQVLTNFEIFAAAGGMNRAIDRVFNNIAPNAAGQIVIQFASTAASPDKNSKVDAIQVIPQPPLLTPTTTQTLTPLVATSTSTRTRTPTPTPTRMATHTPTTVSCPAWSSTVTYDTGDVITFNGQTYTALVPHTLAAGINWTPANSPQLWSLGGTCRGPIPARTPQFTPPPATWQEHWFEHVQLMKLIAYNNTTALYFDDDVNKDAGKWMLPYLTKMWKYAQTTYGGNTTVDRLFSLHHEGKYSGGHPSYFYSSSHDFRNLSDVGGSGWINPQYEVVTHETGHVVESVASGKNGSPAFPLWGDSKWMEFYIYDVYVALGMTTEAQNLYNRLITTTDSFPVAGAHWFRDWFYPLWRDHGHAQVMVNFFRLLGQYFPTSGNNFSRDLNWGEYVHFMSGAAGTDLRPLATTAFGWPANWESQFQAARQAFPQVTY
jgi:hypothetical protein